MGQLVLGANVVGVNDVSHPSQFRRAWVGIEYEFGTEFPQAWTELNQGSAGEPRAT